MTVFMMPMLAPINRVVVGRQHLGDENGSTKYATAVVKFNGHPTEIKNYAVSETRKESGGWNWFKTSEKQVLTGRHHSKCRMSPI